MLRHKPLSCEGCACYSHGSDFSAVEGTGSLGVMLVGEASGEHEQRDQLPFRPFAPAGSLLERSLRRMGFDRAQFSITNVLRCRPRNNWTEGSPWQFSAIEHCRPNLNDAVGNRRPRSICSLGGVATSALTGMAGEAQGVSHLAGYVLPSTVGTLGVVGGNPIPIVPNFHPAFLRRGKASYQGVFARILQRAVNVAAGRDTAWMWGVNPEDSDTYGPLNYFPHANTADIRNYIEWLQVNPDAVISYDLETSESASLDEDAREGFADTRIRLAQFSAESGQAIALDWERHWEAAVKILRMPNVKCGHNVWLFDNRVLRANGVEVRGVVHDTLAMFHHWQPDLPAHLQFCASYVSFPFPWKHLAATDIEFYGCCDVDATLRLYTFLESALRKEGLFGDATTGYLGQMYHVRPVLSAMEDRGLPIDDAARISLGDEFDKAQAALGEELVAAAPLACCRVHPKAGYKGVPPEVKLWAKDAGIEGPHTDAVISDIRFTESGDNGERYHYVLRAFDVAETDAVTGEPVVSTTTRWCRVYDFNPNSWQQLLAYMDARGHKRPKSRKNEDAEGNAKDTTEKKELVRLAHKHGDTFYLKVIEYRELSKMCGTYIDGFKPGADGRVHTTFAFDTGTGQLAARNPNVTNFPKRMRLAKRVRTMVAASKGRVLAEWDYKSYHVVTTGFCAEDPSYIRLARLDMHSFVAWHLMKLSGADSLIGLPDDELAERLAWFKKDEKRKWVRDNQSKPSILGIGFGMGYRRLYQENLEYFKGEREAKRLHDLLKALFPRVFAWQDKIRKQAHEQRYLRSPFGHIRRFYEVYRWDARKADWMPGDQAEEAVAFLPANIAFGNIRETMKELRRRGLDAKYGLCNNVHDSFLWEFSASRLDEHVAEVGPILTRPSDVLRHPVIAPEGLVVDAECSVGPNWAEMETLEIANHVKSLEVENARDTILGEGGQVAGARP